MSESSAVSPSSRYCGLNAIGVSSPSKLASMTSTAWASSPVPGLQHQLAGGERQPHRGVALGHQGDPLDRLGEQRGGQLGLELTWLGSSAW